MRPPLGSGARFKALTAQLATKPKVRNPKAVADAIGAKKYGQAKMTSMATAKS